MSVDDIRLGREGILLSVLSIRDLDAVEPAVLGGARVRLVPMEETALPGVTFVPVPIEEKLVVVVREGIREAVPKVLPVLSLSVGGLLSVF